MFSDRWPPVRVRRFDLEPSDEYRRRRTEIVSIVEGFRRGRFTGIVAERLDERLEGLLTGTVDINDPAPALIYNNIRQLATLRR